MDKYHILPSELMLELTSRFEDIFIFHVAYGTTDLYDRDIRMSRVISCFYLLFHEISQVWYDLDGTTEVVSSPLLHDDLFIELAGSIGGEAVHICTKESLIVTDIEICLSAICRHEDFSMLGRIHSTGIDIEISIEFLAVDTISCAFEDRTDRCSRNPLTDTREDASCDEDDFHEKEG